MDEPTETTLQAIKRSQDPEEDQNEALDEWLTEIFDEMRF